MIRTEPGGPLKPLNFENLRKNIPELSNLSIDVQVCSFSPPLDSSDIGPDHWLELAKLIGNHYHDFDGFVILHGTDTLAYTSSCLSFLLKGLRKPVVMTGAQLPIGFQRTDARNNIITALEIASCYEDDKPVVQEVAVYFDYLLFRGNRVSKIESHQFDAYSSENYPPLAKVGVDISFNQAFLFNTPEKEFSYSQSLDPNVAALRIYPGMERGLEGMLMENPPKGMIIESFGSGNIPNEKGLIDFLEGLIKKEVPVLNLSQCPGGEVNQGKYQASKVLNDIGVLDGSDLSFEAGLTKMMYCIGNNNGYENICKAVLSPISGEMKDNGSKRL